MVRTSHDDVIKWKHFPRYWPFVRRIHRSPVNSPQKASDAELWCFLWINGWANNRETGDLRRHRANHDVIVMMFYGAYVIFAIRIAVAKLQIFHVWNDASPCFCTTTTWIAGPLHAALCSNTVDPLNLILSNSPDILMKHISMAQIIWSSRYDGKCFNKNTQYSTVTASAKKNP